MAVGDSTRARAEVAQWRGLPQLRIPAEIAEIALGVGADSAARHRDLARAGPGGDVHVPGSYLAMLVMAATHDRDAVMTILNAARPRGAFLHYFMRTPLFDSMRDDPRFAALYREVSR